MRYLLDTNVFNRMADGLIDLRAVLPVGAELVATHLQRDEIAKTPDAGRRMLLQQTFFDLAPRTAPTETAVWDVSRWDEAPWGSGPHFDALLAALNKHTRRRNNREDALIGEVALANGWTLVTADHPFAEVVQSMGGRVITLL